MNVITRFAPSPTGMLHIGGARTALFNYLFAKHHGGKYLLRIEDTDKARSTEQAIEAITQGLGWLGLAPDETPVFQSAQIERHQEVVDALLEKGAAYRCYTSKEQLAELRAQAEADKRSFIFRSPWREADHGLTPPAGEAPVIRLKAPDSGEVTIEDQVQGTVTLKAGQLDDMILMRSDGTPTYMCAVVVDDHDMGITHVIRGDDHFTNSFRQALIYQAMEWEMPVFAHIPLIHGADGAKLSKRHGALGVDEYRKMGYLPVGLRNYLLRLGWSHGDDEIISDEQAIAWFDFLSLNKAPARFDMAKLDAVNAHYLREMPEGGLLAAVEEFLGAPLKEPSRTYIHKGLGALKLRAKRLDDLIEAGQFYLTAPTKPLTDKAAKAFDEPSRAMLGQLVAVLNSDSDIASQTPDKLAELEMEHLSDEWTHDALQARMNMFAAQHETKLGKVMGPVRVAITGSHASPSMFEVMEILGKEESLSRLNAALAWS